MTDQTPDREALDKAQGLTDALTTMAAEVKRLRRYGRFNRKFVILDIILTIGFALSGGVAVHAAQQASSANSAQLALCQAGNVARAQQIGLWEYVLHLGPRKHQTAAQKKVITAFQVHLHTIFAPRDCAALGQPKH